jgi:tetratricopeptide (TPR) repeat protein
MRSLDAGDKTTALTKALAFRAAAPGDVLALLGLGEVLEAMGELRSAARAYGSIIDLFPGRADLRRMAGERLERLERDKARWAHSLAADSFQKAVEQRPDHPSSHRLLSFARLRAGDVRGAFDAIEAGAARTYPSGRFLGVDRILKEDAGLIGAAWIKEEPGRRDEIVDRLGVLGATVADRPSLRFVLLWETDNNDVDFHIHDGKGGHAYYGSKALPSGGSLYADVTTGYGPECFAVDKDATGRAAPYKLEAHYFSRGPMGYGMGKLEIIDHDGKGTLSFEERPYVIMTDRAYVQLGTYPASADGGRGLEDHDGARRPALPRP